MDKELTHQVPVARTSPRRVVQITLILVEQVDKLLNASLMLNREILILYSGIG
jgi:hypothetical protein